MSALDAIKQESDCLAACENGSLEKVMHFVQQGGNPDARDGQLLKAAAENNHIHIVRFLLDKGAKADIQGSAALWAAAKNGHLDAIIILLANGADINGASGAPLTIAAWNGHFEVVKFLVENGADVERDGGWCLLRAAEKGHLQIVRFLAEKGLYIYTNGNHAFTWSKHYKQMETYKYLFRLKLLDDLASAGNRYHKDLASRFSDISGEALLSTEVDITRDDVTVRVPFTAYAMKAVPVTTVFEKLDSIMGLDQEIMPHITYEYFLQRLGITKEYQMWQKHRKLMQDKVSAPVFKRRPGR